MFRGLVNIYWGFLRNWLISSLVNIYQAATVCYKYFFELNIYCLIWFNIFLGKYLPGRFSDWSICNSLGWIRIRETFWVWSCFIILVWVDICCGKYLPTVVLWVFGVVLSLVWWAQWFFGVFEWFYHFHWCKVFGHGGVMFMSVWLI